MTMSPESISPPAKHPPKNPNLVDLAPSNNNNNNFSGFKFPLDDPTFMLPADELFSNGKLIPLHLASVNSAASELEPSVPVRPQQSSPKLRKNNEHSTKDPSLFSPRAPKCSSRWKEILGLKRLNQREKENKKSNTFSSTSTSIKSFLNRASKPSSIDSSLNLPLLKDSDTESVSVSSSRMSLSSSSSSHEHDDLPRVSIDSDIKNSTSTLPRISVARAGASRNTMRKQSEASARVSVDSPRMNSSGKIVFHNLERSSSTPSSNYGGRYIYKNKGIERSYSAHVRITSVPVCSLRRSSKSGVVFGFPLFSSSQQSKHYLQQKNGNNSKKKLEKLMGAK